MGTSSIYGGPKDKNPLLPEDFEPEDKKLQKEIKHKPWQATKKSMSQIVTGSSSNYRGVIKNHIRASGGSTKMAESAISGRGATIRLGSFLNNVSSEGIIKTLQNLRIDSDGKNVDEILSELVNHISFKSDSKEDIVAKEATIEALMLLYEYIEVNDMDLSSLDSMNTELIDIVLVRFISSYIWGRMLNDLQKCFEKYSNNPERSFEIENDFKEYIRSSVEIELDNSKLSLSKFEINEVNESINELYQSCYTALGGLI